MRATAAVARSCSENRRCAVGSFVCWLEVAGKMHSSALSSCHSMLPGISCCLGDQLCLLQLFSAAAAGGVQRRVKVDLNVRGRGPEATPLIFRRRPSLKMCRFSLCHDYHGNRLFIFIKH